jgi:uncharacterized protein (TIGR03437 family)
MQVSQSGVLSDPVRLAINPFKPAVFTVDQSGSGEGAIINVDGTINGATNPAARGSYISIYGTGGGQTTPSSITGQIAGPNLSSLALPVTVVFGGNPGTVTFAGAAPLEVGGIFQVNVNIPADAPVGPAIPLRLSVGDWAAQINVTVAIQ